MSVRLLFPLEEILVGLLGHLFRRATKFDSNLNSPSSMSSTNCRPTRLGDNRVPSAIGTNFRKRSTHGVQSASVARDEGTKVKNIYVRINID